jgi:hypothetical protein
MRDNVNATFAETAVWAGTAVLTPQLLDYKGAVHTYAAAGQTGRRRILAFERGIFG